MISSHTGFQPLVEVWVGDTYPAEFYNHLDNETQDIFSKITEITKKDLNKVEKKLTELGVIVQRPNFTCLDDYLDDNNNIIKPPICPRDWAITLNDTLYILPQYPSGVEPFQLAIDTYIDHNQKVKILNRSLESRDSFVWSTFSSIVRVGKDLYIDYNKNNKTVEFYNEKTILDFSQNYRVHVTNTGDHSDGVFCPVGPGQIFSTHYRKNYTNTFPGWEVYFLNDTTQYRGNGYNGAWWLPSMDYPHVNEKIVANASTWLGNTHETVFEVNMLIVDEKNVICIAEDDAACRRLESLGITPHVINFETRGFWDGGMHCLTLDIHRQGDCLDYWPNRGPNGIYRY